MQDIEILTGTVLLVCLYVLILTRWERGVYWLVAYMPFAGAVTLALHLWQPSLLFKDIFFVIPLYIAFFARMAIHRVSFASFPPSVACLMLCLAVITILQAGNSAVANVMMGLIGIKVWLLYLPLCVVAYTFADSVQRVIVLLRLMVALSFIPAIIAVLQFSFVGHFGYHATMQMSYGEAAADVTQNFGQFQVEQGSYGRIPSIFTFVTQFFGFSLAMLPACYILSRTDPSPRWRRIGTWGLAAAGLATFISGARSAYVFTPLLLGLIFFLDRGLRGIISALSGVAVLAWIAVTVLVGAAFWTMYSMIGSLFSKYATDVALGGLLQAIQLAPLGMGTGTNTGAARYALSDASVFIGIENYYAKAAVELGIPGLFVVVGLFAAITLAGFKARRTVAPPIFRCCSNAFLAFVIVISLNLFKGWLIDLDPVNVYYWLFVGVLLKISVLDRGRVEDYFIEEMLLVEAHTFN
jgi:hypothetical protein